MTVTVEILPAAEPARTTQPRVVQSAWGTEYRVGDGLTIEARIPGGGWIESSIYKLPAFALDAAEVAILADLRANPTEILTGPAGEDTVVLRMPRSTAATVTYLVGNVIGGGPIRDQLDEVFDALDNELDPFGTFNASLFDEVTRIREELQ